MDNRCNPRMLTALALLAVGAVAAVMVLRGLVAQVYFEPTTEALAEARAGLHSMRLWGGVLAASSFVAAVLTERVLLLVGVLTGLAALIAIPEFAVFLLLPVVVVVNLGVAVAEATGWRARMRR